MTGENDLLYLSSINRAIMRLNAANKSESVFVSNRYRGLERRLFLYKTIIVIIGYVGYI